MAGYMCYHCCSTNPLKHDLGCPNRLTESAYPEFAAMPPVDTPPVYGNNGQQPGNYRADRLPMLALLKISHLLKEGAERHKDENLESPKWLATPTREHCNRALVHLMCFLSGDTSEDHLLHASCRLLFAVQCDLKEKSSTPKVG